MDPSTSSDGVNSHAFENPTSQPDPQSGDSMTDPAPTDNEQTVRRGFWTEPAEPIEKTFDPLETSKKNR